MDAERKFDLLEHLLKREKPHQAIVFCRTKRGTDKIERRLSKRFDLVACHFSTWHTTDPVRHAMFADRETYLPLDLLAKVDRCSMRHALEDV